MTTEEKIQELEDAIVLNQENIFRLGRSSQKTNIAYNNLAEVVHNNTKMIIILSKHTRIY